MIWLKFYKGLISLKINLWQDSITLLFILHWNAQRVLNRWPKQGMKGTHCTEYERETNTWQLVTSHTHCLHNNSSDTVGITPLYLARFNSNYNFKYHIGLTEMLLVWKQKYNIHQTEFQKDLQLYYKNWHKHAVFQRSSFRRCRSGGRLLAMT